MLERSTHYTLAASIILVAALGCSQIHKPEQADAGEKVNQDAFLHDQLQNEPTVTVGEAYRAVLILADGEEKFDSFAAREAELLQRKTIRPEWKLQRDAVIDRGTVAYMVLQTLKIRGGVNFNVYGRQGIADRRYAVRELAYHDLMDARPPYRYMTGAELVDLIGKADAYMAEHGMYTEPPTNVSEELKAQQASH